MQKSFVLLARVPGAVGDVDMVPANCRNKRATPSEHVVPHPENGFFSSRNDVARKAARCRFHPRKRSGDIKGD